MKTDYDIASSVTPLPIEKIAQKMGLNPEHVIPWGRNIGKVCLKSKDVHEPKAKMVLEIGRAHV